MNFFENIAEILGVKDLVSTPVQKATIIGDSAGYFENVKGIKSYTESEVVLSIKGGEIIVRGQNLYVKKYCAGDVGLCGKITAIERR